MLKSAGAAADGSENSDGCHDLTADINAVELVNLPHMTSSGGNGCDVNNNNIHPSDDDEQEDRKYVYVIDDDEEPFHSESADIVDLLDSQIRYCTSTLALHDARQLNVTKRPITRSSSSGTFQTVIDELTAAEVTSSQDDDDEVEQSSSTNSVSDQEDEDNNEWRHEIDVGRRSRYNSCVSRQTTLVVVVDTTNTEDNISLNDHSKRLLSPKKYHSSATCRRALYDKYIERSGVWADGLTASGKQVLLDIQRKRVQRHQDHSRILSTESIRLTPLKVTLCRPVTSSVSSSSSSCTDR